ncbi:unnamed protein product [Chilo suppressalis]|uniref:Myogenesis-regulating glycosidase-like n=1 Tax=Chilo suppressalis TaxID=168631 RepID=A0ABN8AUB6_CHISP|nr:unnamed protein product [Chilo suppressalis]
MMAAWGSVLAVVAIAGCAYTVRVPQSRANDVTLSLEPQLTGGFKMFLIKDDNREEIAHIGRTLVQPYSMEEFAGGVEVQMGGVNLTIRTEYDAEAGARAIRIRWDAPSMTRLEDCILFGSKQWYAGPMQIDQLYPVQTAPKPYSAYVSSENDNGAIVERYWLNSAGEYIYVYPEIPLFVDYNNLLQNHLCFGAQIAEPYSTKREHTPLAYDIWLLSDVKSAHKHAVKNYLGQPSDVPDFRMVQHPIWSTWAQYSREINETNLLEYAEQIIDNGFNNSQFEIDDLWEVCYGSLTVDEQKFPDFAGFVQKLKELGYRVTLWVHPFINSNCEPWYTEALSNGYLVLNEEGSTNTTWWNNNGTNAGYVDFTKVSAAEWFYRRVKRLQDAYGIDSFKFDAGESSFAPQISVQNGSIDLQPHLIVDSYVKTCARFGDMIEVRAGFRTQHLPVFVRMVDRDSIWGHNNGLPTVITTALQMNLNGYTLVLPDMIGGNGYNLDHEQADLPTKELFIRWVQTNTFLPVMQYSFAPWNFDDETVEISKRYTELHAEYAEKIYEAMQASVEEGSPVTAPLWWLDPDDEEALLIWDEYLVGEEILVAPVLKEGATSRDIYLPKGEWFEGGDPERPHSGPTWLHSHPAPLDVLPFFVRQSSDTDVATAPVVSGIILVLGLIVATLF